MNSCIFIKQLFAGKDQRLPHVGESVIRCNYKLISHTWKQSQCCSFDVYQLFLNCFKAAAAAAAFLICLAWWISALVSLLVSYYQQQTLIMSGYILPPSGGAQVCHTWHCNLFWKFNTVMRMKPSNWMCWAERRQFNKTICRFSRL